MPLTNTNGRRIPRVSFGGAAEISIPASSTYILGSATNLSRLGCFVKTAAPSCVTGCKVNLKITYDEREFSVSGEVAYELSGQGLGIVFGPILPKDQIVLEHWISEAERRNLQTMSTEIGMRMAFLNDFPVELSCPQCQYKVLAKISALKAEKAYTFPCGHTYETETVLLKVLPVKGHDWRRPPS
jgi:hypothetical protein